jgi:hypothetical protein
LGISEIGVSKVPFGIDASCKRSTGSNSSVGSALGFFVYGVIGGGVLEPNGKALARGRIGCIFYSTDEGSSFFTVCTIL